jgi:DNA-directed RNA polymerase specialized sigma24 family protein
MRLFMQRGFDAVSVAEIAAAAGVAEKTVLQLIPGQSRDVLRRGGQRAR